MRELKFRFTGELVQNREISGYLKSNKNYIINKSYYKAVKSFMESLAEKPFPKTSQNSEKDLLAFQDWIKKSSAKGGENNEIIIEKNIDLAKNNAKTLWKKCIRMEMDNAECKQLKVNSPKLFACAQKSTKSNNEFYNIILGDFERMKKCVLQGKCY